jgi:hypothetical protein
MKCKKCGDNYSNHPRDDYKPYHGDPGATFDNLYGWHPSFGECIWCFLYSMFGGILEPF